MTKDELVKWLEPFSGGVRLLIRVPGEANHSLMPIQVRYGVKQGVLRLADDTLLENGEVYIEVSR